MGLRQRSRCNSIGQIRATMRRKRQPFAVPASPELGPLRQRISRLLSARADKSHRQVTTKTHLIVKDSSQTSLWLHRSGLCYSPSAEVSVARAPARWGDPVDADLFAHGKARECDTGGAGRACLLRAAVDSSPFVMDEAGLDTWSWRPCFFSWFMLLFLQRHLSFRSFPASSNERAHPAGSGLRHSLAPCLPSV